MFGKLHVHVNHMVVIDKVFILNYVEWEHVLLVSDQADG